MRWPSISFDAIRFLFTYGIALYVLDKAFTLILTNIGDGSQAWLLIGSVIGYILRDAGGAAAAGQIARFQANQPPTLTLVPTPPTEDKKTA